MSQQMLEPSAIRPLRDLVLVRRYERPERIGSIWVPDEARFDPTLSLWEVERAGPRASALLGHELERDDIVATRPRVGATFIEQLVPGFDPRYALLSAQHILQVVRWREQEPASGSD
jgi:hypothetical protein